MAKYIDKIKEDVILLEKLNTESSSRKKLVFNNFDSILYYDAHIFLFNNFINHSVYTFYTSVPV